MSWHETCFIVGPKGENAMLTKSTNHPCAAGCDSCPDCRVSSGPCSEVHGPLPKSKFGPTLSRAYNKVLASWNARRRTPLLPTCEGCECDLTNKDVHETLVGWFCLDCFLSDNETATPDYDDREDFHADC